MAGEVSASEQDTVRKEFSRDSYEEAMIKSGRQAELEEEKRKEQEYLQQSGASADQQ